MKGVDIMRKRFTLLSESVKVSRKLISLYFFGNQSIPKFLNINRHIIIEPFMLKLNKALLNAEILIIFLINIMDSSKQIIKGSVDAKLEGK